MATYYWVGGSGNWNATSTANWSNASGGSSGFGPPTSADDVIFDAGSNVGTNPFTVTVTGTSSAPAVCRDFSTGGAGGALDGAMTLAFSNATSVLAPYGSITLPATNLSVTGVAGSILRLLNATSATLTTNGVSLSQINNITISGGGVITLGSALTAANINPTSGTLDTANYNVTLNQLITSGALAKSIILGSSSVVCAASAPIDFTNTTGFTFNAGTSTITCSVSSPTFNGGGQTFYNVTFSSTAAGTATIDGANTFNSLTFTSRSATGVRTVAFNSNQVVNGTLTFGVANTAIRRISVRTNNQGTQRTITLNGTLAALADVDFRDINAAGTVATPWTGTRLGDGLNNNNITFDAPKTVYWNLAGTQNWSATGWATTNNGTPAVNNFPLAQDTATFTEAGAAGTVTFDSSWLVGDIQMADGISNRTTAFTLATGTQTPLIFRNLILFSNLTLTGTGALFFVGQGTTQTITSAGVSFTQPITVNSPGGTVQLSGNLTSTSGNSVLAQGTLNLNNNTLTCVLFSSSNSNTRTIAFGTGNITVTGNNATVFTTQTSTGLTVTGTPVVNFTYAGATGTRAISFGPAGEANAISVNVTAGTDIVSLATTSGAYRNINFTGFSGTATLLNSIICYGNFTASTGATFNSSALVNLRLFATSGTQTITSNGKTFDFGISVNAPGATIRFADALTQNATRGFFFNAGTIEFAAGVTSTVGVFQTTNTPLKTLQSTVAGTQATLSQASGTVSVSYTTIQDINATGGATWNAFYVNNNVDAGNNTGWNFTDSPANVTEVGMRLRSFTEPRRF